MGRRPLPWLFFAALCALCGSTGVALAHPLAGHSPGAVARSWTFDVTVIIPLVLGAWMIREGTASAWRRYGRGRVVRPREVGAFTAMNLVLIIALISPIDAIADELFWVHMLQHVLLVMVAAPLLVLSKPELTALAALSPGARRRARSALRRLTRTSSRVGLTHAAVIWWLFALVFWIWHIPLFYDAAVRHAPLHAFEHLAMFVSAAFFWDVAIRRAGHRGLPYPAAIVFVFSTMLQMSVLSALMVFSSQAWYPHYATGAWSIDPLTDQQLGALVMWAVSNAVLLLMAANLFVRWFAAEERRARRSDGHTRQPHSRKPAPNHLIGSPPTPALAQPHDG